MIVIQRFENVQRRHQKVPGVQQMQAEQDYGLQCEAEGEMLCKNEA